MNKDLIAAGATIVGIAFLPTPDDITIISPMIQLVVGLGMMTVGVFLPDSKK